MSCPALLRRGGAMAVSVAMLLSSGLLGRALGWNDCELTPDDKWEASSGHSLPKSMLKDYSRRYTCLDREAALLAAGLRFKSSCTPRTFTRQDMRSCLEGRRLMFIGDSLATQQADSLVGMLGWRPRFLKRGDPLNDKWVPSQDGSLKPNLLACLQRSDAWLGYLERCYDLYAKSSQRKPSRTFKKQIQIGRKNGRELSGYEDMTGLEGAETQGVPDVRSLNDGGDASDQISVHMRMFSRPREVDDWFGQLVKLYNGTRPSDVYVVNFGAHYADYGEEDDLFKRHMSMILDSMGKMADEATVVWREMSPSHFPSVNASYDTFAELPFETKKFSCCTGTPPTVLDRNVWVDNYLQKNGLTDKIKVLRIYSMSTLRGASHHSCINAKPPNFEQYEGIVAGRAPDSKQSCAMHGPSPDCRHWSETGVVEEWNRMLLNHICPL